MTRSRLPLLLLPFFFLPPAVSASAGRRGRCCDVDVDVPASREFFPMEGDVAWVVQVSDLHLSAYHHDRASDLEALLAPALRVVRPSLLIVTGDLTDAKNKERTSTRQDEFEWVQYRNSMDAVVKKSGIDQRRLLDIRGNHDKYGVPCVGDKLDFFSVYSTSAQLNRTSTIQSISLVGNKWKYMFVGIDDTMIMGLRGPSNLFGHPTDKRIKALESELQYWDTDPPSLTTKIVFGHFPMSFTASSETGKRYESVFATRSVSAYLCGHLHAKFSKQLWRPHTIKGTFGFEQQTKQQRFWEWELGDWKESRLMRILAVDQGDVSFMDIKLNKDGFQDDFQTTILITYPIDSRSMAQIRPDEWVARNDINVLVFSIHPICNVTAKVYDSSRAYKAVEEMPLQLATNSFTSQLLFSAKWNAENYKSASATRYWLKVFVLDVHGKETASTLRPFSIEGKSAHLPTTWLARLVFYVQWEKLYSALLWSNFSFLIVLLLLPKLLHFMESSASYQRWAMSVSISSILGQRRFFFWPLWFLIEGSGNWILWCTMLLYLVCLLCFPWFWGCATSVNGDLAKMSILGWMMDSSDCPIRKEKLGVPDIMAITLPFLYLVVTPLFLLSYSLFAERSAFYLHSIREASCPGEPVSSRQEVEQNKQLATGSASNSTEAEMSFRTCKICRSWIRMAILFACLIFTYIHIKQFLAIGRAYGVGPVALSPALSLAPPFFLATAVYLSH